MTSKIDSSIQLCPEFKGFDGKNSEVTGFEVYYKDLEELFETS